MARQDFRQHQTRKQAAFTLTDLLTAIIVISLLLAILMPAFGRAVSIARRFQCAANLHNIGKAYTAYRSDEQTVQKAPVNPISWALPLLPYLGNNPAALICPEDEDPAGVGLPNVRVRVIYGGMRLYDVDYFTAYPYWLEGSAADFY
jgi:type II secretory pathway pseudopilin PulG